MPISKQEQEKSIKFMNSLNKILEIIDELSNAIPEGKYLEICDNLKTLNDNKTIEEIIIEFQETSIVRQHRNRTGMAVIPPRNVRDSIKKHRCPYCDTEVLNLSSHQKRMKCKNIRKTKKLSAFSGLSETNKLYNMTEGIKYLFKNVYPAKNIIDNFKNNFDSSDYPFEFLD